MKIRMTVTVNLEDPEVYKLDNEGRPLFSTGKVEREDVGQYVLDAVQCWGGQLPPGHVFFPRNLRSVRVQGKDFDIESNRA